MMPPGLYLETGDLRHCICCEEIDRPYLTELGSVRGGDLPGKETASAIGV
jgi:hypothetical protein